MDKKNILIIIVIAVLLFIVGAFIIGSFNHTDRNVTNSSNNIVNNSSDNIVNNSSNLISENNKINNNSSNEPTIVSKKWKEDGINGGKFLEITYSDGNFRQYDKSGKLIGSSYSSDQKELMKGREGDFD